ncbi:DUF645 family protein [Vibrio cholerae]|nr:DUF645 family protein [Vibrio cholerae]EGR4493002.1 DUF645 family protein [Vibrio cholerae]EJL6293375.1 DUF645 family protein [Vibrio cholerae]ELE1940702.1 DUF645 family protein [Vibrio cholerae]TXZ65826.1 DUF645 family protein [Vibrio cholerae]
MLHTESLVSQRLIITESVLSLSRTLNRGQLNLDRFEFWQPTSQLLALDMCLCDAFA